MIPVLIGDAYIWPNFGSAFIRGGVRQCWYYNQTRTTLAKSHSGGQAYYDGKQSWNNVVFSSRKVQQS